MSTGGMLGCHEPAWPHQSHANDGDLPACAAISLKRFKECRQSRSAPGINSLRSFHTARIMTSCNGWRIAADPRCLLKIVAQIALGRREHVGQTAFYAWLSAVRRVGGRSLRE